MLTNINCYYLLQISQLDGNNIDTVIDMMSQCLPHIVPNVLLAKREVFIVYIYLVPSSNLILMKPSRTHRTYVVVLHMLYIYEMLYMGMMEVKVEYQGGKLENFSPPYIILCRGIQYTHS